MSRPSDFACNIDLPTSWKPGAPELLVEGWFYAGPGRECRDIRAVVDGQVTLGIPGTGMSYQLPLNASAVALLIVAALIASVAYLIAPTYVTAALHWWQPKWF